MERQKRNVSAIKSRNDVKQDGEVMQDAAGQHEDMPDHMVIKHGVPNIEKGPGGIGQSTEQ